VDAHRKARRARDVSVHEGDVFELPRIRGAAKDIRLERSVAGREASAGNDFRLDVRPDHPRGDVHLNVLRVLMDVRMGLRVAGMCKS
jgi:hypothetical protein